MRLLIVFLFASTYADIYGSSPCCNTNCCCQGCNACEMPPPIDYPGVCSCQVCQTSYQPFVFRQQYLPRIYEPPLINYQTRYLPPMVQRYPLNNIGCQSCGMSNYPHTGLPGQISPFPKPPNRMNQMFKPVGNYALPYSGYRTSPYASYPNSILPALQNLAVVLPIPVPNFGMSSFPFPPLYPGRGNYATGPSTPSLSTTTPTSPTIPERPPSLKFNFPAPIVPKSVTFPPSNEDQANKRTDLNGQLPHMESLPEINAMRGLNVQSSVWPRYQYLVKKR